MKTVKMDCQTTREKMLLLADDAGNYKIDPVVTRHLENCVECKAFASFIESSFSGLKLSDEIKPKPYFYTRLQQKMKEVNEERIPSYSPALRLILRPLPFVAILLFAIFLGIKIGNFTNKFKQSQQFTSTENSNTQDQELALATGTYELTLDNEYLKITGNE
jgi:hypothetical protein